MAETDTAQALGCSAGNGDALLQGLREGAPEAHAALYDRFAPGLHRFRGLAPFG